MKKKRLVLFSALCVLFAMLSGIVAFAGDYDTPVVPICNNHIYDRTVVSLPTCTENGVVKYTCRRCNRTYSEQTPAYGHLYNLGSYQTYEGVQLRCRDCGAELLYDAEYIQNMWINSSGSFINNAPRRTVDLSVSAYLDLDGNGIINAKDFGIIMKLVNNQKKLIEAHNQNQNSNARIEFDLNNFDEFDIPN